MRSGSIFRATAILSASSGVTILLGLVSSKVNAVFLGPTGYGYLGLLQSMVNLTVLIAGFGLGGGLVRMGASRVAQNDWEGIASLWQAARLILTMTCILTMVAVVVFRNTLSTWFLGTPRYSWSVAFMGVVVVFTLCAGLKTNILNAYHRVEALATNGAVVALLGTIFGVLLIVGLREKGIVPSIFVTSVLSWLVAWRVLRKTVGPMPARAPLKSSLRMVGLLLRFCVPYTASMIVGTGVQMFLPVVVLHMMGPENVGYFRAAVSVSVTYLSFLITAMAQDYFPRVSAVSDQPKALCDLVNNQQRLILLLGVPIILGTLALVPLLIPLVYSLRFAPTVEILEWQLIGDFFKFSSWTMSYVILARSSSLTYFLVESVSGITTLATSWLGIHFFGLTGLGMSFVVTYIIYYLTVWAILHKKIGFVWTKMNLSLLLAGFTAGVFIRILPNTPLRAFRMPIGMLLAFGAAIWSLDALTREMRASGVANLPLKPIFRLLARIKVISEEV
jgi:O-antigen/teichoic acid export membrane protein